MAKYVRVKLLLQLNSDSDSDSEDSDSSEVFLGAVSAPKDSEKLNICDIFTVALAGKKKFAVQDIYVAKDSPQPILGGPAPETLDLITKNCVNEVNSEEKTDKGYKQRYSKLVKG